MTTEVISAAGIGSAEKVAWRHIVDKYRAPSTVRALWQVANTFIPYIALWAAMYWCLWVSWWLVWPLAMLAGLFLVRIFIIFHDCGHGSFFPSQRANAALGFIAGILTFTPFYQWRYEHAIHHSTAGHLDKRGVGDIWTMTVQEYRAGGASPTCWRATRSCCSSSRRCTCSWCTSASRCSRPARASAIPCGGPTSCCC
jgi:omega-6 fatty acid desaturase (delta-12 desaturase)